MSFWNEYTQRRRAEEPGSGSQGDTAGVCGFCGLASDDVLIGVCADCAEEECACP